MTSQPHSRDHLAAFRDWALAEGHGNTTWIIERQEARRLFEQLEAVKRERDGLTGRNQFLSTEVLRLEIELQAHKDMDAERLLTLNAILERESDSNPAKCPNCKGHGDVMNWLTGAMERCSKCGGSGEAPIPASRAEA